MKSFKRNFISEMPRDRKGERGFVLPLAVFLAFMLSISGMSFLQLDFTERLMARKELDNHDAFYLANAGIERARGAFKVSDSLNWTSFLADVDEDANLRLCPNPERGCAFPPFDPTIESTSGEPPFDNLFNDGSYQVRAFNNVENPVCDPGDPKKDCDQQIIVRALGTVRNEEKILEVEIRATSGMKLISCEGDAGSTCPEDNDGHPTVDPMEGRDPASFPTLPQPDPALTDTNNYYRKVINFPTLSSCVYSGTIQDNCHYVITGDASLDHQTANNVVIFATGKAEIKNDVHLTNATVVGVTEVKFQGSSDISANLPYPAIISGGDVDGGSADFIIHGTIYAAGTVSVNPIEVHGVVMGGDVAIQGDTSTYTDDGKLNYYDLMPGFSYSLDQKKTAIVTGTWREIE